MRLKEVKSDKFVRLVYIVFITAAMLGIASAVIYIQLVRHMKEICEYKGKQTATALVSEAIDNRLKEYDLDLVEVEYNDSGEIISISANSAKINELENELKSEINRSLSEIDDNVMSVPIGTLSGITILSGRGMDVKIKLHQTGAVDTHIVSEFSSAGINQTKHTLKIEVTTELSAILPGHSTDITVTDEYLISERIIVGAVPDGMIYDVS